MQLTQSSDPTPPPRLAPPGDGLAPADADARSLRSDQDSDSDDDALQQRARSSGELRALDRRLVLGAAAETDRLVAAARGQRVADDDDDQDDENNPRQRRRARRAARKAQLVAAAARGSGTLLYAMEEGGLREGSATGESSERGEEEDDEEEEDGLLPEKTARPRRQARTRKEGGRRCWRWLLVHAAVVAVFVLLAVGAWRVSVAKRRQRPRPHPRPPLVSNGTALFGPTTLVLSLDGFRADFLQRGLTPRLNGLAREGVSAPFLTPAFPSVTFPNHYTLVTGLHPESHGVVGNTFWDPARNAGFVSTDPARSLDARWWGGEPLWVTAERAGVRTAVHMWPGSEAAILGEPPTYVDRYNGDEALGRKVERILELLDKPGFEAVSADADWYDKGDGRRPQLIAAYVPNVDADGHRFGPNSTALAASLQAVDAMLADLLAGLDARNLTGIVNVVVVSDHGMATTDAARLLQLEDLVGGDAVLAARVAHVDGWPLVGLRPRHPDDLAPLFDAVRNSTADQPHIHVYLKDADESNPYRMPPRFHFTANDRIAPLWLVPDPGWGVVARAEFDVAEAAANGIAYHPRGLHGYDNQHPLMRAIFVARGPAFAHPPNSRLAPFPNTDVYNLLCDSLGLAPRPNNGTLRLPLAPVGLWGEGGPGGVEDEGGYEGGDGVWTEVVATTKTTTAATESTTATATTTTMTAATTETTAATTAKITTSTPAETTTTTTPQTTDAPDNDDSDDDNNSTVDKVVGAAHDLWGWFTDHVGAAWDKLTGGEEEGEGGE